MRLANNKKKPLSLTAKACWWKTQALAVVFLLGVSGLSEALSARAMRFEAPPLDEAASHRLRPVAGSDADGDAVLPRAGEKIANPVAVFSGLDKITGRIFAFDVMIDETVQFGALRVTPRVCYTRPVHLPRHTTGFVEVEERTLDDKIKRLFSGWMFAESPGLNAVEHPIYDVWLKDCKASAGLLPSRAE